MYTAYIVRRTQIYIGDDQDRLLDERAGSLGTTKSAVIRDAIDAFLQPDASRDAGVDRLRAAVRGAAGIAGYLPSGSEYVEDLRAADLERERELEARRVP
jgi:hypothetical protein